MEQTLSIIKPDVVERNQIGLVLAKIEEAGLKILSSKLMHLSVVQAQRFYAEHRERPFFGELVEFMSRGPVLVSVLEGENAIDRYRLVMGATDPAKAEEGTIRALFGSNVGENAVHGSDSAASAQREIRFFFSEVDLLGRNARLK